MVLLKVLILSWEYPPHIVGEMAWHVRELARRLKAKGLDVYVATYSSSNERVDVDEGVVVSRVKPPISVTSNIVVWSLLFTSKLQAAAAEMIYKNGPFDIVDAHEWITVDAALALKDCFEIPFVYTLHSLEKHRSANSSTPLNIAIEGIEELGCREAKYIIVNSEWMRKEVVTKISGVEEKINVAQPYTESWIDKVLESYQR
ncbi:MAG: glycosyltransferase family 4 protein [Nitrososphaerales archaeon]